MSAFDGNVRWKAPLPKMEAGCTRLQLSFSALSEAPLVLVGGWGGGAAVSVSTTIPLLSSGLQRGHKSAQPPAPNPLEGAFIGSSLGFHWVDRINPAALHTPIPDHMWAHLFWLHICRLLLCQMSQLRSERCPLAADPFHRVWRKRDWNQARDEHKTTEQEQQQAAAA